MHLKGTRGLFDTVKSSCTWGVASVSLRLGVLPGFWGLFWAKNGCLWPKIAQIWEFREFLAQNLDPTRPPPRLQDGYMGKRSEALGRSNGRNGMETCLLLVVVACC